MHLIKERRCVHQALRPARARIRRSPRWDYLEPRCLLSTADPSNLSNIMATPAAVLYSPGQIRTAYTVNSLPTQYQGAGETIAIVDAYNDPNITKDLASADSLGSIPAPPSFTILNENGATSPLPRGNTNWGVEESLDVEWAHAIAPAANLLLVEANSSSLSDLLKAVDTARNYPGVAVVSMSWGSSEFSGEASNDSHFTTPSGHTGVTFVASSGDSGGVVEWPAASPNVLSVGGTTLTLNSNNTWASETAWSGSGGGVSRYESTPSYQSGLGYAKHSTPDVAYDANPNTGVYVYDTYGYGGLLGVGGTAPARRNGRLSSRSPTRRLARTSTVRLRPCPPSTTWQRPHTRATSTISRAVVRDVTTPEPGTTWLRAGVRPSLTALCRRSPPTLPPAMSSRPLCGPVRRQVLAMATTSQ